MTPGQPACQTPRLFVRRASARRRWRMVTGGLLLGLGRMVCATAAPPPKYGAATAPLVKPHQGIAKCAACHLPAGDVPNARCLQCHAPIGAMIQAQRKLHGAPALAQRRCAECHPDHPRNGSDLLRTAWNKLQSAGSFDHGLTGFALTGRHTGILCQECHDRSDAAGHLRFPDRSATCTPCHAEQHAPSLGQACRQCHTGDTWNVARFDHDRTRFALTGKHRDMAEHKRCTACHTSAPRTFSPLSLTCDSAACHRKDDIHQGQNTSRCADCHDTRDWDAKRSAAQGHAASAQPLSGAHDRLPCLRCHGDRPLTSAGMASACLSCHQRDDIHHQALGPRCGDCHTQQSFTPARFRHESTGCSLRGVHRVLPCIDCHKAGNYAGLSPLCISCHRDDAARAAGIGRGGPLDPVLPELHALQTACTHCHNPVSFRLGAGTRQAPPESVCQ